MASPQPEIRFSSFHTLWLIACLSVLVVQPALSQAVNSHPAKEKFTLRTDVSLGVFGQVTPARTPVTATNAFNIAQTIQGTSPSAGILATLHQSFSPLLGYNINFGYSRFVENYSAGNAPVWSGIPNFPSSSSFSQASVGTNMYEITVAYAVHGPKTKRFNTFAQFGGGGLFFLPTGNPSFSTGGSLPYDEEVRATVVFGAGVDYRLTDHLGVRAEYRGLFYKNPDFRDYGLAKLFTVTSEPAVSIVYSFGGAGRRNHLNTH